MTVSLQPKFCRKFAETNGKEPDLYIPTMGFVTYVPWQEFDWGSPLWKQPFGPVGCSIWHGAGSSGKMGLKIQLFGLKSQHRVQHSFLCLPGGFFSRSLVCDDQLNVGPGLSDLHAQCF